jgi:hypothetical protein
VTPGQFHSHSRAGVPAIEGYLLQAKRPDTACDGIRQVRSVQPLFIQHIGQAETRQIEGKCREVIRPFLLDR